jgi:hypothetical protein
MVSIEDVESHRLGTLAQYWAIIDEFRLARLSADVWDEFIAARCGSQFLGLLSSALAQWLPG